MHVVVIGGGLAGVGVATHLVRHAPVNVPLEVTLIDPKEYFEVRWAALRAFYDEGVRKEMHVPYSEILSKYGIAHCQARVSTLSKSAVITDAGALFKFDVCLIAVGASCALPGLDPVSLDIPTRRARMTAAGDSFINKDVLIIGGGTVGVEVAGEIAEYAQKAAKNVTLVHSGPRLAHTQLRPGASRLCQKKLEKMGVRVVLNAKAQEKEEGKDKGEWIVGDEVFKAEYVADCRGYKPVADFMKKGELASALDEKGWIKVDNQFRVEGCEGRVFAMGDCCNTGEKTGVTAMKNVPVVSANIASTLTALANNKASADIAQLNLKKKKDPPPFVLTTLGPKTGVADTPLGATASVLPMLKNKTMFIGHAKSTCGI